MNKAELAIRVAVATDLSDAAGHAAIGAVFDVIARTLAAGERVAITNFGAFEVKSRSARQGRNPRTGETVAIAPSRSVAFKPAAALREALKPGS